MDRGAWQATVHGITRVRHDLVTKPPPPPFDLCKNYMVCISVHDFFLLISSLSFFEYPFIYFKHSPNSKHVIYE